MQQIDFSQLKEYDSLSKREQDLLREIQQENERLSKINSLIAQHLARREEIKSVISDKNARILDNESQLKVVSEQMTRLIDQGLSEERIQEFQQKIQLLEDQSFQLLEEIDVLEEEMRETHQFEQGARQTLKEISGEVQALVEGKEKALATLRSHQQELLEAFPERVRSLLLKLIGKNLIHGPFTKIEGASCMMCRFKISKIDEAEIDVHKNLKQCPQCSRIFIPYGV